MVPYSERRHRLNPAEIYPVRDACRHRLTELLEERNPEDLPKASILFRVWYRIDAYCTNKPKYPAHDTWEEIQAYLNFARARETMEEVSSYVGYVHPSADKGVS